jgi:hypothetical protein
VLTTFHSWTGRVGQQVVGAGQLQEQDVEQEGATADALDMGLAPKAMAATRYQIEMWAATLICCDEWPKAHQMVR